jgi:O-antigen/teichoic acid export membrane protein
MFRADDGSPCLQDVATMSTARLSLKGGAVASGGQVLGQAIGFARNIVIARLLSPTDIGVAALLASMMSLVEMTTDLNAGLLLIQAKDGDEARVQGTVHSLGVVRGVIMAAALFCAAAPLAWLFSIPDAAWAFRYLAAVPLLRNIAHSDASRVQRRMNFLPNALAEVSSQVLGFAVVWYLAVRFRSYSAILWATIVQAAVASLITHLCAERRYTLGWSREHAGRVLSFGWPLLINGLLLFVIFQGDRVVIGLADRLVDHPRYTLADLGLYFLAFNLAAIPVSLPAKIGGSLCLPLLSREQDDRPRFVRKYVAIFQGYALVATLLAVPLIAVGGHFAGAVYGAKYAAASTVLAWLAAMQGVRLIRASTTLAALALGDSTLSLLASVVRLLGFPAVLVVAYSGKSLAWIAAAGFFAELGTLVFSLALLRRRHRVGSAALAEGIALTLCAMAVTVLVSHGFFAKATAGASLAIAAALTAAVAGVMLWRTDELRMACARLVTSFHASGVSTTAAKPALDPVL